MGSRVHLEHRRARPGIGADDGAAAPRARPGPRPARLRASRAPVQLEHRAHELALWGQRERPRPALEGPRREGQGQGRGGCGSHDDVADFDDVDDLDDLEPAPTFAAWLRHHHGSTAIDLPDGQRPAASGRPRAKRVVHGERNRDPIWLAHADAGANANRGPDANLRADPHGGAHADGGTDANGAAHPGGGADPDGGTDANGGSWTGPRGS